MRPGWFNPKKTGGWGFPLQNIRVIAVLSGTKLRLLNLHVIIIFDVYNNWEKKFGGGCIKKIWKILNKKKFFFVKTKSKIFKNSIFANIFYQTVLFNTKYQFEMISAFIWCIYCLYWSKIIYFQNFCPGSWKFCFVRWAYFGTLFWKKFESQYGFWSFHRRIIMPKVLWVHFWWIWMKILAIGPR